MAVVARAAAPQRMASAKTAMSLPSLPPLLLLLALVTASAAASDVKRPVPMLIWSSSPAVWVPPANAHEGHVTTDLQLSSYLQLALDKGPPIVLLLLQEELSVEDFTVFGGAFGNKQDSAFPNLENALKSAPSSLILPLVEWRAINITLPSFLKKWGPRPVIVERASLEELKLKDNASVSLHLTLPHANNSGLVARKMLLTGNDEIIGQVVSKFKAEGAPYTAIMTAIQPSRVVRDLLLQHRTLNPKPVRKSIHPLCYNDTQPRILFWADHILVNNEYQSLDLNNATFNNPINLTGSSWNSTFAQLVLTYDNIFGPFLTIKFKLSNRFYPISARTWFNIDQVELHTTNSAVVFQGTGLTGPSPFSFHCHAFSTAEPDGFLTPPPGPHLWNITFKGFRIQAFHVKANEFAYACDCAGFFSGFIWMGLFSCFFLLLAFIYGLHMLLDLKTMDTFENPKGRRYYD
ncbi:V-type proton ATPase subunit S1-like [Monodelphis domestica]|uniref:ATPase H+ transporting accessory protein 1 n=1 Tax=Monodelphis domestica TaxID=13616 RepID=A0A5F8GW31_MONDO|nr:V-type proton ATPase subunit S1-like [Monodelphis domestica]